MPELPEVEALASFLRERAVAHEVTRVDVVAVSALKTIEHPISVLSGQRVDRVERHGKFLDLTCAGPGGELHLVIHLARAGWLRWSDSLPDRPPRPGKGPLAVRVHLDDGSGFDLTEAGTQKRLAVYLVTQPDNVPGLARLGPDPLADDFTPSTLRAVLAKVARSQVKGVLIDQTAIAGVGNAYSDEILHTARLSPFKPASRLSEAELDRLYEAIRGVLTEATTHARGLAAKDLKAQKKTGMAVHGRAGEACGVCGQTVREVSFAESSLQYCPGCQTGGKPLADRRLSKLLK